MCGGLCLWFAFGPPARPMGISIFTLMGTKRSLRSLAMRSDSNDSRSMTWHLECVWDRKH